LHATQGEEVVVAIVDTGAEFSLIRIETLHKLDGEAVIKTSRVNLSGLGTAVSREWSWISFKAENRKGDLIQLTADFLPWDLPSCLGIFLVCWKPLSWTLMTMS
jgi:hypothetical protein